jgi:hypothetical protein
LLRKVIRIFMRSIPRLVALLHTPLTRPRAVTPTNE